MLIAGEVAAALDKLGTREKAASSARFFKTGEGQYGHGDVFVGVPVPAQRRVARVFRELPLAEAAKLLKSRVHEHRLTALLILVEQYKKGDDTARAKLVKLYLARTKRVNNWDLVDMSAPNILGRYLLDKNRGVLYQLAKSENLWERRIAIVATLAFIGNGESADTFAIAELLLSDTHDLIHKATGWMLREVGKRVSRPALAKFITLHKAAMPRTMLRYAIEHFSPAERGAFLAATSLIRANGRISGY